MTATATTNRVIIAPKTIQPWRRLSTMRPYVAVSPAGMIRIASISTKFESHVGFSNGIAELTLKKPPPLVPSILIASWPATGPKAKVCVRPVRPVASTGPPSVCRTPCDTRTRPTIAESGIST